jgi:predicted nuclease of predicted toxin-antitoxin system
LTEHIAADSADADVLQLAQKLDAVLLTFDLDFSNILDYPPQDYPGTIVLRYEARDETALTVTLRQALSDLYRDDLRGALVIITPYRYRIRRP